MKIIKSVALATALFTSSGQSAIADDNELLCSVYGSMSQSVVNFMLPLTFEQILNMITGKDNLLMGQFTQAMMTSMKPEALGKLATSSQTDIAMLSQHAGQTVFQMMMSGQILDMNAAGEVMENKCLEMGSRNIINRMEQAGKIMEGK